jgi:hypothetical protein
MPLTTEPNRASRKVRRVLYPMLPSILDEDSLSALSTLESEELVFVRGQGRSRSQVLHALYLKAKAALGHSHFEPKDLPRQFRQRIVEKLQLELDQLRVLSIDRGEKSHIVSAVRAFLGIAPLNAEAKQEVICWLEDGLTKRESDVAVLVKAASERFREERIEIPSLNALQSMAQQALTRAEQAAIEVIERGLESEAGERLDGLLSGRDGRPPFDLMKDPLPQATVSNLASEPHRVERLESVTPKAPFPKAVTRHQVEHFAQLAHRCTAPELGQISRMRRRALLLCFVRERRTFLLDAVAEMLIRVWENTQHRASEHANVLQRSAASAHESQQGVLSEILSIIKKSRDPEELWRSLHQYKSPQEYEDIWGTLKSIPSWNGSYLGKIEDHYPALRRFLPDWYRLVSLSATTANDAIPRAQAFAKEHADMNQTELPVEGCPVEFLRPPWDRNAVKRFGRTGRIVRVQKAPFELGLLDATVQGLQKRTVAIAGGRRYAPMIDHLLPRSECFNMGVTWSCGASSDRRPASASTGTSSPGKCRLLEISSGRRRSRTRTKCFGS